MEQDQSKQKVIFWVLVAVFGIGTAIFVLGQNASRQAQSVQTQSSTQTRPRSHVPSPTTKTRSTPHSKRP